MFMKTIKLGLILCLGWLGIFLPLPAIALSCYPYQGTEICILTIKRSAKYHWEYRASVKVNGVTYPDQVYNCRTQTKKGKYGKETAFSPQGVGEFLCKKVNKSIA